MDDSEKTMIARMLHEIILSIAPKATPVSKYGGVLYTLKPKEKEGQFCGVFMYSNHVQLAISNQPILKDPKGVLQGSGKTRRHINFETADEVDAKILVALLQQAAKS